MTTTPRDPRGYYGAQVISKSGRSRTAPGTVAAYAAADDAVGKRGPAGKGGTR